MKRLKFSKNFPFKLGTNRLVILFKNSVIKLPLSLRGVKANQLEYNNYLKASSTKIAQTSVIGICLKQERLNNITIYPRYIDRDDLPDYAKSLFDIKVNNRLQIGQDNFGRWKIFDYEDIKFIEEGI